MSTQRSLRALCAAAAIVAAAPVSRAAHAGEANAAAPSAADPHLVAAREDRAEVKSAAHKLLGITVAADGVAIETDGEVARIGIVELRAPARLALDLHGVTARAAKLEGKGPVQAVRVAKYDDGIRIVVDGQGDAMPKYDVRRSPNGVAVRLVAAQAQKPAPEATKLAVESPKAEPKPQPIAVAPAKPAPAKAPAAARLAEVKAIDLRTDNGKTEVLVALDAPARFDVTRPDDKTSVLTLHGAALPERLERNLDAKALGGPVQMLSSYRAPDGKGEVRIVASHTAGTPDTLEALKGTLIWKFDGPKPVASATQPAPRAAAMASEVKAAARETNVYDSSQYSGRKVDFNVKDIDIRNLLGAISEISKKNIIVADDVRGTVTIKLRNVPWDQALDIILKSKGLGREEVGNIIRVAPIQTLRAEQKEAAEAYKNRQATEPLKVRLIPVNYAKAAEMVPQVKESLTERGSVTIDSRTNTLIVKDVHEALLRAEGIVRNLDTQTPEVLIEARIVEAATSFARQAGIQWGGSIIRSPTFGNATGLTFPNVLAVAGAADDPSAPTTGLITNNVLPANANTGPNFAVNMPAPVGQNNGAGLGFVFGSAGGAYNLNLRLSAAENSGTIKTISSPRVVTIDNVDANISQGISIPYSQTSAAGVSTTFIEARLELRVTPHVTQEGSIQLRVNATNNQPNPQLTGSNGQPSISRREARTEVLVKDGDTTVIGGIYTRRNSEAWNEVPILSKIPILGWLFKKKAVTDDRTELLIFITPRIVNRSQSVVTNAPSTGDEVKPQ